MIQKAALPLLVFTALILSVPAVYARAPEPEMSRAELLKTPAGKAFQDRQFSQALASYKGMEKTQAGNAALQGLMGASLFNLRRYEEAKIVFKKSLRIDDKDLLIRYYLAETEWELNRADAAISLWKKISESRKGPVNRLAADALAAVEKREAHPSLLSRPKRLDAKKFSAMPAAVAYQNKNYLLALAELKKMKEIYSAEPLVYRYGAKINKRTGHADKAIAELEEGRRKIPLDMPLRYDLAGLYRQQGEKSLARDEYQFIRDYDDSGVYAKKAARFLQEQKKTGLKKHRR